MPSRYTRPSEALGGGTEYVSDNKGFVQVAPKSAQKINIEANKDLPNLFPKGGDYTTSNISPKLGTEIKGIQLSQLNDAAKDEVALLAAQRGVLVFRDQDFIDKGPEFVTKYVSHYGPLHIHPTSGAPKDHPDIHVVLSGDTKEYPFEKKTNLVALHSDAVHSAVEQANFAIFKKGHVKRHPVENMHPIVRTTPLGQKVLYVNNGFTRRIEGLKEEESSYLLNFLLDHIWKGHDFQIRAHWEPNTVVIFDNRVVGHTAILDFDTTDSRLIIRASARGERPVSDLKDLNKPDENLVYHGAEYLGDRLENLKI
ncbi:Taurine catabolism dioxygenase TauD, TfdA family protein [Candida albicans]|uniref:Taurine catabolism dioxygenase TauD, TfdA family protein n=1 Tax=Candida albicans TaxID=5476 RepID=A0A8H6F5V0_CANAX|nr:Taurine catabolism dioxygenase TauD, TfdA family protein [Candida albicans]